MPVSIKTVSERFGAAQYDGTNGAEIAALFGLTPDSDDGQTLVFSQGVIYQMQVGWWIIWSDYVTNKSPRELPIDDATFQARFVIT